MSQIELENVSFTYGGDTSYEKKALDGVSVTFRSGIITGLIGHTGSGKSTLVQLLNGLLKPQSGRVLLDGKDIWADPKRIRNVRFKVGLVMQYPEYQLFDETVRSDIAFGPRNMGMTPEETEAAVEEAARFTGLDRSLLDKSPFDLSGGQKRRAALAGVIAMHPGVLVRFFGNDGYNRQSQHGGHGNVLRLRHGHVRRSYCVFGNSGTGVFKIGGAFFARS